MDTTASTGLALTDRGAGEPALLFLPGWCGDRSIFDDLVERLGTSRRALSVDWPGHGESPLPENDFGYDDLVDASVELITSTGLRRVVPVGLSHAGWVAVELRRRLGDAAVPGIVLLDWMVLGPPPPFLDALQALQHPDSWEAVRGGLFSMWTSGLDIAPLTAYVDDMGGYGFEMWSRAGREIHAAFARHGSPLAALERLEPPPPTLHLYAQPDDPALLAAQQEYASTHPWFWARHLQAASHFPMFEVPEEMATLIEEFVVTRC
jgi:pimeloyl-ACP methyl ester carboxylesterase